MKTKVILTSLALIAILSLFTTCKKYPENTLWFKTPESEFVGGKIIAYTVDGIDSIPMWDAIYAAPPYNGYGNNVQIKDVVFYMPHKGELDSNIGRGSFHFYNNKKYLYMFFYMSDSAPPNNIFVTIEGNWRVLKLTGKGDLRIQRTYNNKVYEIEFN